MSERITHSEYRFSCDTWTVVVPRQPIIASSGLDTNGLFLLISDLQKRSKVGYADNGQSQRHLEALEFLRRNWPEISKNQTPEHGLHKEIVAVPCFIPEVWVSVQIFGITVGHALDGVAVDSQGRLFIIEIASPRGHKSNQLAKQKYIAQLAYPEIIFNTMVAKYNNPSSEERQLFLHHM